MNDLPHVPKVDHHPEADEVPDEGSVLYVYRPAGERPAIWAAWKNDQTWGFEVCREKVVVFE